MEHLQTFIPRYFIVHPVGDRFQKYENLITLYLYAVQAFLIYFGDIFRYSLKKFKGILIAKNNTKC